MSSKGMYFVGIASSIFSNPTEMLVVRCVSPLCTCVCVILCVCVSFSLLFYIPHYLLLSHEFHSFSVQKVWKSVKQGHWSSGRIPEHVGLSLSFLVGTSPHQYLNVSCFAALVSRKSSSPTLADNLLNQDKRKEMGNLQLILYFMAIAHTGLYHALCSLSLKNPQTRLQSLEEKACLGEKEATDIAGGYLKSWSM